jgi:hypothetical protein
MLPTNAEILHPFNLELLLLQQAIDQLTKTWSMNDMLGVKRPNPHDSLGMMMVITKYLKIYSITMLSTVKYSISMLLLTVNSADEGSLTLCGSVSACWQFIINITLARTSFGDTHIHYPYLTMYRRLKKYFNDLPHPNRIWNGMEMRIRSMIDLINLHFPLR